MVDHPVALRAPPLLVQGGEKDRRGCAARASAGSRTRNEGSGRTRNEGSAWIFPSSFEEGCRRRRRGGAAEGGRVVSPREGWSTTPSRCARHPSLSKEGKKIAGLRAARERWLKDAQ